MGTWSKKSTFVTGRRPFGKDTEVLNYDYDSEAEWEEEEPGEDIEEDKDEDIGEEEEGEKVRQVNKMGNAEWKVTWILISSHHIR
jgi:chromatin assembly factor 1 subunit A